MAIGVMLWLSRYLLCGVISVIVFDWLVKRLTGDEFTNGERLSVIVFWPIMILSFIWGWIGGNKNE